MKADRYLIKTPRVKESFLTKYVFEPEDNILDYTPYNLTYVPYCGGTAPQKKAIETIARYFQREFKYDFVQYTRLTEKFNEDAITKPFLFTKPDYDNYMICTGACVFRYRTHFIDLPPHWALQWIWLHPYERNKGILTSVWEYFEKTFGEFIVETPISKAMQSFLETYDPNKRHSYQVHLLPEEDKQPIIILDKSNERI